MTKYDRYNRSEKGRARTRRYDLSPKGRVKRLRYWWNDGHYARLTKRRGGYSPEALKELNAAADRMVARL